MKFKNLPAKKLKILMALFFGSGILGIIIGLTYVIFLYTVMGVINLMIGALVSWMFLTREPRSTKKGKQ